jgi:hypothetical protein
MMTLASWHQEICEKRPGITYSVKLQSLTILQSQNLMDLLI